MKTIKPSYKIMNYNPNTIKLLEKIGRTCYKSETNMTEGSEDKFVKQLIDRGHEAMIEFSDITVKFIHNRGFLAELTRHRLASFAVESTRYCNYSKDKFGNELTMIEPYWLWNDGVKPAQRLSWKRLMEVIEDQYFDLVKDVKPEGARGILPNDLKTEIVIKANIREWRNIFKLRCDKAAHPDMRLIMVPLLDELTEMFPVLFEDIQDMVVR